MTFAHMEVTFALIKVTVPRNGHGNPMEIPDRMNKAGTNTGFNAFKNVAFTLMRPFWRGIFYKP